MSSRFWSSAGPYGVGQHGFWPYPVPKATAPSEYEILTNGTSYTFKTNEPAALTLNGSSIGSTASSDGRPAALAYTPSATVYDSRLNAVASGINAIERRIAVAEASHISQQDISNAAWGKVSTTAAARGNDANGLACNRVTCSAGSAQHYVTTPTLSPTATSTTGNTFEFIIKPSGTQAICLNVNQATASLLYIDLATGDSQAQYCSGGIVERFADGRLRIQISTFNSLAGTTMRLYPLAAYSAGVFSVTATAAGTEYIDIYSASFVEGRIAHRGNFMFATRFSTLASNLYTYNCRFLEVDTTYASSIQDFSSFILVPSTYNASNTYKVILVLGAFPTSGTATQTDEMSIIQAAALANTYNVIVAKIDTYTGSPWWGSLSTGMVNTESLLRDGLLPWLRSKFSIGPGREYVGMMGWSKSAWGALSNLLRNPTSFGYAGIWDINYNETYADGSGNGQLLAFDSNAQYILYNPKDILAANLASINDKKRIHLAGSARWQVDTQQLHTDLTSNSILHNFDYHDMGNASFHVTNSGWIDGTSTWASDGGSSVFAGLIGLMPA